MSNGKTAPIACSLSGEDYQSRLAWIRQLAEDALIAYQRNDLSLHITYAAHASDRVREMVAKEQACCAFLDFDLHESPSEIRLTIRAPEEARPAADGLFNQFIGGVEQEAACGCC